MIDDFESYFGGRLVQLEDAFRNGEKSKSELEGSIATLDDEMTDALEDDDLSSESYAGLSKEIEKLKESCGIT